MANTVHTYLHYSKEVGERSRDEVTRHQNPMDPYEPMYTSHHFTNTPGTLVEREVHTMTIKFGVGMGLCEQLHWFV